ncbi:MAG: hypothetical protein HZB16_02490 [Armatimonadetes bacterium]|nr:hypothetical protein [Armatimonadota bacterium]
MRKLFILIVLGVSLVSLSGCGKPADKKPSWNGAPTTDTKPPTGKAGEAAENLPVPKDKSATTTCNGNEGGATTPAPQ